MKSLLSEKAGVFTIHLFDWYPVEKIQDIIRKASSIGTKINADDLIINKKNMDEVYNFISTNSLRMEYTEAITCTDTSISADHKFYVLEDDTIYAVLELRLVNNYNWEIVDFVERSEHIIDNAFHRLFEAFVKENCPKTVSVKCDYAIMNDNIYTANGFAFEELTKPNLRFWTARNRKMTKKEFALIDAYWNSNKNARIQIEKELLNHRIVKIYDAGNKIFTWRRNNN